MRLYLDLAVILNFVVDLLLLVGTNRIAGYPCGWKRCLLGAAVVCSDHVGRRHASADHLNNFSL